MDAGLERDRRCPALLVTAPASGQGKTSVTCALARWHRRQGRRVRVFKIGPDFLDPLLLARASAAPVYQLDLWLGGEDEVRARLHAAAGTADLILIEGVMGLYDGEPSSADVAGRLGLPIAAVIDGSAMAQTFGAVAGGLAHHRPGVQLVAVAASRVGGDYHARLLRESLPPGIDWLGALPQDASLALPERHLGLVPDGEQDDIEQRLDALAEAWSAHAACGLPAPATFAPGALPAPSGHLRGVRIAVARDAAFCFLYPANVELLQAAGADLRWFSPVAGDPLPACDAVWLPGGYPELHLQALSANNALRESLGHHHDSGKPLLAECGGLLSVLQRLEDVDGQGADLFGLLPGSARIQPRLAAIGMQSVQLPEGHFRGHSFHHAQARIDAMALTVADNPHRGPTREAVYRHRRLTASFMHLYFPSNPDASLALLRP